MIDHGKRSILGIGVDALDYEAAVARIISAAHDGRPYGVSALAVHGVMTGVDDPQHAARLNRLDLVTPDGQPVRWALNLLHGAGLKDRVYGPRLTLEVCRAAASEGVPVFFYGSDESTLNMLRERLPTIVPGIIIAGTRPSRFGTATPEELDEIARAIRSTGARITFVGLGCPRQEVFAYENRDRLSMPTIAVGAAFAYHAGIDEEPPAWMQKYGLQWLHRFVHDPRRLWHRYLVLNPRYVFGIARQKLGRNRDLRVGDEPQHIGWA